MRRRLRGVDVSQKDAARALHAPAVRDAQRVARPTLAPAETELVEHFARGDEVQPADIQPRLVLVEGESEKQLFRYASLHWSIPVSAGYGRRLRFLVEDASNGKLIGLIGLGDPVYALRDRDAWIGWTPARRSLRLRCVMDAFVLGAVPPYSQLLGGKLVATLATSAEVQDMFWKRYRNTKSLIKGTRQRHPLAMLTTTSAYGRSSLYNRLTLNGQRLWQPVGFTQGTGEFLFAGALYARIHKYVDRYGTPSARAQNWGKPDWRNRREVIREALHLLSLPYKLHVHGLERAIFAAPLAPNAREWLAGSARTLERDPQPLGVLADQALARWVIPRAARYSDWRQFDPEDLRLWSTSERQRNIRRSS